MSLLKSQITVSAREIAEMVKNKVINFDHILQRSYVWERWRKSELIESAITYSSPINCMRRWFLRKELLQWVCITGKVDWLKDLSPEGTMTVSLRLTQGEIAR